MVTTVVIALAVCVVVFALVVRQGRGDGDTALRLGRPVTLTDPEVESQARAFMAKNQKIEAIKVVRVHTGMSLQDCKDYVESL